jgi:hypothetical protein
MIFIQSYQIFEDLARAFSKRTLLQIFLEDEMNTHAGSLKVYSLCDVAEISLTQALLYFGIRLCVFFLVK